MKKYCRYFELLFFGLVNVVLSLSVFVIPFLFSLFPVIVKNFDKYTTEFFILFIFILIINFLFKIFTLPFIYWLRTILPNTHKFLFKIIKVKKFRLKFFMICVIYDISIFLVLLILNQFNFNIIYIYLFVLGGILPCYLAFVTVVKIFKPISFLFKLKNL